MLDSLGEKISSNLDLEFIDSVLEKKFRYSIEVYQELHIVLPFSYGIIFFRFSVYFPHSVCLNIRIRYFMVISWIDLYGDRISDIHKLKEEKKNVEIIEWKALGNDNASFVDISYLKEV